MEEKLPLNFVKIIASIKMSSLYLVMGFAILEIMQCLCTVWSPCLYNIKLDKGIVKPDRTYS